MTPNRRVRLLAGAWKQNHTSAGVVHRQVRRLPKPERRVRFPSPASRRSQDVKSICSVKFTASGLKQQRRDIFYLLEVPGLPTRAPDPARIAQLAEQLICNQQVVGSSPTSGFARRPLVRAETFLLRAPAHKAGAQ